MATNRINSLEVKGNSKFENLILTDQKTGKDWTISIYDGKISIEPFDKDEKRDFRIKNLIDEN